MKWLIFIGLTLTLCSGPPAIAEVPPLMNFQCRMTDSLDIPLPDGQYSIEYRIFDNSTHGQLIWSELQSDIQVRAGLANSMLGKVSPIDDQVFAAENRWLTMSVNGGLETSPRVRLVTTGYSFRTASVDGAKGGQLEGDLSLTGSLTLGAGNQIRIWSGGGESGLWWDDNTNAGFHLVQNPAVSDGDALLLYGSGSGKEFFIQDLNVNVQGWISAEQLTTFGPLTIQGGNRLRFWTHDGEGGIWWDDNVDAGFHLVQDPTVASGNALLLYGNGSGTEFRIQNLDLKVQGTTSTGVLEITGGSDLAEPFETSHSECLPAGSVVVIDQDNPGMVKLSNRPYDKRVAGVISGAGGVNPGLTLRQEESQSGGQLVALTGQVYVHATASNGAIEPGDLLTTSATPGCAMRVTDYQKSQGAILGKAMTGLKSDSGLVLVLVALQ